MKLITGALAFTSLLVGATISTAQEVTEITVSTEVCLDEVVRQERCQSFEGDITIQEIADAYRSAGSHLTVESIIRDNGWENVGPDTIIKRGVFIRTA